MVATSCLFFMISGIQFWVTDYMRVVLHMPDELAFTAYTFSSLTAPVTGVIVGGAITHCVGGYSHPNAMRMLTWVSLVGVCLALPLPFLDSW